MKKWIFIVIIFLVLLIVKSLVNNTEQTSEELIDSAMSIKSSKNKCIPIDRFYYEHPDASQEELYQNELCNKKRATRLGLNKRSVSFLGNTISHPKSALAHYEVFGTNMKFTVYDKYILTNAFTDNFVTLKIPFSDIKSINYSSALNIEYLNEKGAKKLYSIMLLSEDDVLKDKGERDSDRLVELLQKQRKKYQ